METPRMLQMLAQRAQEWRRAATITQEQLAILEGFLALIEAASRDDCDQAFMIGRYGPGSEAGGTHAGPAEPLPGL